MTIQIRKNQISIPDSIYQILVSDSVNGLNVIDLIGSIDTTTHKGAIMESGSNANGIYIRLPNGIQISFGSGSWTTQAVTYKDLSPLMPSTFTSKKWGNIVFNSTPSLVTIQGVFGTTGNFTVYTATGGTLPAGLAITYSWIVVGRWYE